MLNYKKVQLDGVNIWLHVYRIGCIDGRQYMVVESVTGVLWDFSRITNHKDY